MEYIKEEQILLNETVCKEYAAEDDELRYEHLKRFKENIRLVGHVARKYIYYASTSGTYDVDDIFQLGYLGLWNACINYNPDLGFQFSTYAYPMIRGSILRFLRDNTTIIHTPRWFKDFRFKLYQHGFELPLNKEEIDILLEEGEFTYDQIMTYTGVNVISLDTPIELKDSSVSLGDMIQDPKPDVQEQYSEDEVEDILDDILKILPPQNRDLAEEWMYSIIAGEELTQVELSRKYKQSQANISRILRKVKKKIQENDKFIYSLFGI